MKIIIDRFEGDFAIVELASKETVNMPRALVPKGAKEGAVLNIQVDDAETIKRKKEAKDLFESLFIS